MRVNKLYLVYTGRIIWGKPGTQYADRQSNFLSAGRRRASAEHRLYEFQKSWHRPGVVRRDDARTTSAGDIKYV